MKDLLVWKGLTKLWNRFYWINYCIIQVLLILICLKFGSPTNRFSILICLLMNITISVQLWNMAILAPFTKSLCTINLNLIFLSIQTSQHYSKNCPSTSALESTIFILITQKHLIKYADAKPWSVPIYHRINTTINKISPSTYNLRLYLSITVR